MKSLLTTILVCALATSALADEASHRVLATKLLALSGAKDGLKNGFFAVVDPMIKGMKDQGLSEAGTVEMRAAIVEWFDNEVKWEELEPKMVELYTKEFTEPELQDMINFYETPTGRKTLERLGPIMQQGAQIGQEYFNGKQDSLTKKIQPIIEKHKAK